MSGNIFALGKAYKILNPEALNEIEDEDDVRYDDEFRGKYWESMDISYNNQYIMVADNKETEYEGIRKLFEDNGIKIDWTIGKPYSYIWYNGSDDPMQESTWDNFENDLAEVQKECQQTYS